MKLTKNRLAAIIELIHLGLAGSAADLTGYDDKSSRKIFNTLEGCLSWATTEWEKRKYKSQPDEIFR